MRIEVDIQAPPLEPNGAANTGPASGGAPPASTGTGVADSAPGAASVADRVDIQPLDVAAALQILLAEARMEFGLMLSPTPTLQQSPMQAARGLIEMMLQAVPEEPSLPMPSAAPDDAADLAERAANALQTALDRAVDTVAAWRGVPQAVVDAAKDTRGLVAGQMIAEPPNALWLRPEWLGLAPCMQRFWRRRGRRRALTDPDAGAKAAQADSDFDAKQESS